MQSHKFKKVVVFDLDETLGYFIELGIFWDSLQTFITTNNLILEENNTTSNITQYRFNQVLDLYPEFIRPDILVILEYLKRKNMTHQCQDVMIYTNNQGPKEWVYYIKNYFNDKLQYQLFNRVISAFKVNGKRLEMCRTSHNKMMTDFIRCAKIPKYTEICYLDDTYYPDMNSSNVYYIKIKPYTHDLPFDEMIARFTKSSIGKEILGRDAENNKFADFMKKNITKYAFVYTGKNKQEYEIDKIITKKIMSHIELFFQKTNHSMLKKTSKYKHKYHYNSNNNSNRIKTRKHYSL